MEQGWRSIDYEGTMRRTMAVAAGALRGEAKAVESVPELVIVDVDPDETDEESDAHADELFEALLAQREKQRG